MAKRKNFLSPIMTFFKRISEKREAEYSKRLLNRIVNSSILMMWATYILAWCGKADVVETLSKTIATSIIAVVVGYLAKSVIENISKHTNTFGNTFGKNLDIGNSTSDISSDINTNRDC